MARILDNYGKFISDLTNGILMEIVSLVNGRDDLVMCFRDGTVNVYYKGHNLFEICESSRPRGYKVSFDLGHARYTNTFDNIKNTMMSMGFKEKNIKKYPQKNDKKKITGYKYGAVFYICENKPDEVDILELSKMYMRFIDDTCDENKSHDYFKDYEVYEVEKKDTGKEKSIPYERMSEQEFMYSNNKLSSDWYLIDMEYSVKGLGYGRFDMIGVSRKKNSQGKYNIGLIELKTGLGAIGPGFKYKDSEFIGYGNGVAGHIVNFYNFLYGTDGNKNVLRLAEEITASIKNYHLLGINLNIPEISIEEIDLLPVNVKCMLIISDIDNKMKKEALLKTKRYIFKDENDSKTSTCCAEEKWNDVKQTNSKATQFKYDFKQLDINLILCNKERSILNRDSRKLDLEEMKKWIASV